ncbi:unnamed protein product [Coregonus sp. 'balchen']|nr:unnamed protein product [Coregonus sp. 'balchen']
MPPHDRGPSHKYHYQDKDGSQPSGCFFGNIWAEIDTIKHYLWMIHVLYVRYWKESHFHTTDLVRKALETVYGSDKPTMTSAALHWMYHHSHLKRVVEAFKQVWDLEADNGPNYFR